MIAWVRNVGTQIILCHLHPACTGVSGFNAGARLVAVRGLCPSTSASSLLQLRQKRRNVQEAQQRGRVNDSVAGRPGPQLSTEALSELLDLAECETF